MEIPRLRSVDLGRLRFNHGYCDPTRPVIVVDAAADWRATKRWNAEYLRSVLGKKPVTIATNDRGVYDYNVSAGTGPVERRQLPFDEALAHMQSERGCAYYLQQASLHRDLPELLPDVGWPYLLDRTKQLRVANLWVGGDNCRSPLHFDMSHNFVVQIAGTKDFTLFPPSASEDLYPATGERLPHCSQVNIFAPDEARFPRFREAKKHVLHGRLEPGNLLFIPRHWWHAVESHDLSIMVNFWWLPFHRTTRPTRFSPAWRARSYS